MTDDHVHVYREPRELRNKRVALELLGMLEYVATNEGLRATDWATWALEQFRERWEARGITWLRPAVVPFDPDEWLTAVDMAERADVSAEVVRRWAYRGRITSITDGAGRPLYNVGEVARYQARRHHKTAP